MAKLTDKPKRESADILAEIEKTLSTMDGIATGDAFKLGGLVREYGQSCQGEAFSSFMLPLIDSIMKPNDQPPKDPWRG